MTGSKVGEREGGSGKVLKPGFKVGTPVAQQLYVGVLPSRLSVPTANAFLFRK